MRRTHRKKRQTNRKGRKKKRTQKEGEFKNSLFMD